MKILITVIMIKFIISLLGKKKTATTTRLPEEKQQTQHPAEFMLRW